MLTPWTSSCGNGIIDAWAGETCDVENARCVYCQLVAGAQCASGACCDVFRCGYAPSSVACTLDGDDDGFHETKVCGARPYGHCGRAQSQDVVWSNCGMCLSGGKCGLPNSWPNTGFCGVGQEGSCDHLVAYSLGPIETDTGQMCVPGTVDTSPEGTVCAVEPDGRVRMCETGPDDPTR